jgi:hypothetical protein
MISPVAVRSVMRAAGNVIVELRKVNDLGGGLPVLKVRNRTLLFCTASFTEVEVASFALLILETRCQISFDKDFLWQG